MRPLLLCLLLLWPRNAWAGDLVFTVSEAKLQSLLVELCHQKNYCVADDPAKLLHRLNQLTWLISNGGCATLQECGITMTVQDDPVTCPHGYVAHGFYGEPMERRCLP